jgi:uncharacterized membrane protein YfcA
VRALLASPLGFLIGVSLGALGGGGSILAVPALVYVAGQDPKAATATSLVLVTVTALVGILPHARAGRVRFDKGVLFAAVGLVGTVFGSRLNALVDGDVLLLAFSGVMLVAAALMFRSARRRPTLPRAVGAAVAAAEPQAGPTTGVVGGARVVVAGTVVGLLTGFFGVGGGFVIVPALVLALGFSMPEAVGTSMLVIVLNSLVALGVRLGDGGVDWAVVAPFAVSSIAGVFVGSRLADHRDPRSLQRWFAGLLVAVAVYTAGRSLVAVG